MKQVVLIPGTHAWDGVKKDWYSPGEPFHSFIQTVPGHQLWCPDDVFVWSSRLGGIGFGDDDLLIYKAAGINLRQRIVPRCTGHNVLYPQLVVISHSHGLQPALFAAEDGLVIDLLIDVCGPVRKDMFPVAERAKKNIRRWVHLHGNYKDRWQWYGTLFDGRLGVYRKHPLAENKGLSVDHGSLLRNPLHFSLIREILTGQL